MYQQYGNILYGFILQFTNDESLAATILEQSIESLMSKQNEFPTSGMSPVTFLKQVTRAKAIDILNEYTKKIGTTTYIQPQTQFLDVADALSPLHREIFCRRYYSGKDERVIARELMISEIEVKQKVRETAKALRDHL